MKFSKNDLLLYLVTDRRWLNGKDLSEEVQVCIDAGVTFVQLRDKDMDYTSLKEEAIKLKKICTEKHVPLVINDYVALTMEIDADGVHVGQNDMDVSEVRKMIGTDKILGVSVQTVEQAIRAEKDGADYLGVGAIFPTTTKVEAKNLNIHMLRDICESVSIPVVAIGGITKDNVKNLSDSNANGAAVVSAILASLDVADATRELKEICREVFIG